MAAAPTAMGRLVRALVGWRNWRLPVKLAAVTLVPVIFAITLSAIQISGHVHRVEQYSAVADRVAAGDTVRDVIAAAQRERNLAAVANAPDGLGADAKRKAERPLDTAVAAVRRTMNGLATSDEIVASRWQDASYQLGRLPSLRGQWQANPDAAIAGYSDLIGSLLALDRALAGVGADSGIARSASALYALDGVTEQVFHEQAVVLAGITRGHMTAAESATLRDAEAVRQAKVSDFRSLAAGGERRSYADAVGSSGASRREGYLHTAIENGTAQPQAGNADGPGEAARNQSELRHHEALRLEAADWNGSSDATTAGLHKVANGMADDLRARASQLRDSAFDAAVTVGVILLLALLLATAGVWIVARQLARSIRTLHRSARQVAEYDIPAVVSDIQRGAEVRKTADPVPVGTDDEVGQLARAFDAVHVAARGLAVEQAGLRSSYGAVFVNLSRRSQSLVQRQLRLLEQLERDEEDPDQLSTLFQLDHLATRMRRNNENLMVLSGNGQSKPRSQAPTPLGDLLRASVSEIEQYQRVTLHVPPQVHIVGYAAGDIVRLLAELLDNATAFSAPETQVTVSTHQQADTSVVVDIVDEGIGMREDELDQANRSLAGTSATELPVSRRMGLFVVARLAETHGITVKLYGGEGIGGLRAGVTVPPGLVLGRSGPKPVVPDETDLETTLAGSTLAAMPALPGWTGTALSGSPESAQPATNGHRRSESVEGPAMARDDSATRLPGDISSAALFAATTEPSRDVATNGTGAPRQHGNGSEKTPIFDEMISAWFDPGAAATARHAERGEEQAGDTGEETPRWRFEADSGWDVAREVARSSAQEWTPTGLPKRTPRARLVPGSAGSEGAEAAPDRDAQRIHDRLASFQSGVSSGRHAGADDEAAPPGESGDSDVTAAAEPAPGSADPVADTHSSGLPQRTPGSRRLAGNEEPVRPAADEPEPASRWGTGSDEGWQAATRVAQAVETGLPEAEATTASGLPRREPKAHLVPGSVAAGATRAEAGTATRRDPAGVRDRLSSFQRGVQEGRGGSSAPDNEPSPLTVPTESAGGEEQP